MIRIEVRSKAARHISGTSKAGKPYSFYSQDAYAFCLDASGQAKPYPTQIRINHNTEGDALEPGVYTLAPESLWVDKFGALVLSPKFVKLEQRKAA